MKKINFKVVASQALGAGAGAIGGSMISKAVGTLDPMIKNVGLVLIGAVVSATARQGSAIQAAGNGVTAVGAIELGKSYAVISGVGAYPRRRVGAPAGMLYQGQSRGAVIGRDGELRRDGILGVRGIRGVNNATAVNPGDFNGSANFNGRTDFS